MTDLVRAASLSGYLEMMAVIGGNPRPFLREQGLTEAMLANPEQLIPATAAFRLLERSAKATGCLTLGLRMAEQRSLANLGATSLLIAHQPSLRHALAALAEFRLRINSTLMLTVEPAGDEVYLREDFSLHQPEPSRQSTNLALGVLARLCQSVLGADWTPRAVCFSHDPPPPADMPLFPRIFGCPAQFNSEFDGIIIPAALLDKSNARADLQLAHHARHLLEAVLHPASQSTSHDVEQMIKLLLPAGRATIESCAASLGLTVRTLQRRLDDEGETFSALLDRARRQMVTQYLANRRMRLTDMADLLGYSSLAAFSRWYASRFGHSPRASRGAIAQHSRVMPDFAPDHRLPEEGKAKIV